MRSQLWLGLWINSMVLIWAGWHGMTRSLQARPVKQLPTLKEWLRSIKVVRWVSSFPTPSPSTLPFRMEKLLRKYLHLSKSMVSTWVAFLSLLVSLINWLLTCWSQGLISMRQWWKKLLRLRIYTNSEWVIIPIRPICFFMIISNRSMDIMCSQSSKTIRSMEAFLRMGWLTI